MLNIALRLVGNLKNCCWFQSTITMTWLPCLALPTLHPFCPCMILKAVGLWPFTYVFITCFHESWTFFIYFFSRKKFVFSIWKIAVMLAFFNLFWFLYENPFTTDQSKRQISWKNFRFRRFRIRENMWWTRYRSQTTWWTTTPILLQQNKRKLFLDF